MTRFFFDIETDGLLEQTSQLHSLVMIDADTGEMISSHGADLHIDLCLLQEADEIIGHNVIKFDVPVLQKLYPWFKPRGLVTDTLVLSRLIYPDMFDRDHNAILRRKLKDFPGKLRGSHGLKAWGHRLGFYKGDFGETTDWAEWTPEMQSYCEQDVRVTERLYHRLMGTKPDPRSIKLEHEFATVLAMQERHGFAFNEAKAIALYQKLVAVRLQIADHLQEAFPPKVVETIFIPKANNRVRGYVKGVPCVKRDLVVFNPSSRQMIADRLKELGWQPEEFTPSGQAKVDETILGRLPYPEAKLLARHFLVEKRIGQLAEGDQAWLKLVRNGRIHGSVNPNGAVTGRCTHSNPNVAQVPSVKVNKAGEVLWDEEGGWGAECRELFTVSKGFRQVGIDLSGLELRCLAHFMAKYDGGAYGDVILNGDIHTVNQLAAGLPTRNNAKTFIYAFLYGAGDQKIGSIVAPLADPEEQKRIGKKLKREFLKKTPALKKLKEAVSEAAKKGWIVGLDGRKLHIRSEHSALNTLLQSAGALIAKAATVIAYQDLLASGYVWGRDFAQIAHVHDEMQFEVREGLEEIVGKVVVNAMRKAGEAFGFRIPIDGEYKIGSNWKDCH